MKIKRIKENQVDSVYSQFGLVTEKVAKYD
jgi:hypothetical protein